MRHNLLVSTALTASTVFVAGAAWGADLLPVKAALERLLCRRQRCALSGHAHQEITLPGVASVDTSGRTTGFTGGGQIGCNWQPDPNWVLGLEADINYLQFDRTGSFKSVFIGEDTVGAHQTSSRWLGTARVRAGYVLGGGFLYATAGLAISDVSSSFSAIAGDATFAGSLTSPTPTSGWTAGAGYEYAFTWWISAKVEYLHFELGGSSYPVALVTGGGPLPAAWAASQKLSGDIVRVGINFQLHQ